MSGTIVVVCAWCLRFLGTKPGQGSSGVSHGICTECKERVLAEEEAKKRSEEQVGKWIR